MTGAGNEVASGSSIANVYRVPEHAGDERLDVVSFVLWDTKVDYSVRIYVGLQDEKDPASGTALLTLPLKGTTTYEGFYKLALPDAISLESGPTFAVVVTLSHANNKPLKHAVDANLDGLYQTVNRVGPGQSFERDQAGGVWDDLSADSGDAGEYASSSARIKAYAHDTGNAGGESVARAVVTAIPSQIYTGRAVTPVPLVRLDGRKLEEGAGRAEVSITAAATANYRQTTKTIVVTVE